MQFFDASTGWMCSNNLMVKTTNGGVNWVQITTGSSNINNIYFVSAETGWIVTQFGQIMRTTNSGVNWGFLNSGTDNSLNSLSFISPTTGWIVGSGGTILKTTDGCGTFVKTIGNYTPDNFVLEQNYPNPFNPITNIRYGLPKNSFVHLTVYDALGREIETLVNDKQSAGTYETTFNASGYPSGVYFYRLTTDGFSETKKMLMIK